MNSAEEEKYRGRHDKNPAVLSIISSAMLFIWSELEPTNAE